MDMERATSFYAKPILRTSALHLRRVAKVGAGKLADLLLPPRCLSCSDPVGRQGTMCATCWPQLRWIQAPHCACCGLPFAHAMGAEALCAACLIKPPAAARSRSVLSYDAGSSRLISRFKYQDGTLLAPALGGWMARVGQELLPGVDCLVPVPLHWRRLLWRRYNQAGLLAGEVARMADLPVGNFLYRTRTTRPQAELTRTQRLTNVKGLFKVKPKMVEQVKGQCLLLVDDVHTTGATLEACAKALLKAGAREVRCLTFARTLFDAPNAPISQNIKEKHDE